MSYPKQNHQISIVISVSNEDGNLRELYSELMRILSTLDKSWEIIFVDDGSTDKTWEEILLLNQKNRIGLQVLVF
ncbi:MAG: glycosyltransferase [Deltaproteobacteria bacterium]|nr:glycosyltransferase [Deltaproteobacteria bacterium]